VGAVVHAKEWEPMLPLPQMDVHAAGFSRFVKRFSLIVCNFGGVACFLRGCRILQIPCVIFPTRPVLSVHGQRLVPGPEPWGVEVWITSMLSCTAADGPTSSATWLFLAVFE